MLPKTHGIMVAGASSCISAAWIRSRVVAEYDTTGNPPCRSTLIKNRLPLAVAGLGFTGLSAVAAQKFDKLELLLLADQESEIPWNQQLDNHRKFHSIPYVGGAVVAAHLIRHSVTDVGQWIAEHLGLDDRASAIIRRLEELADWVVNSLGTGVLGHILADIPTKGAIQFLKPITDRNLALNLVKHGSPTLNKYLQTAGWMLAGGAWAFSGIHLYSWKPPERKITEYLEDISHQESMNSAVQMVYDDILNLFSRIIGKSRDTFLNLPLFSTENNQGEEEITTHLDIFDQHYDSESIWGIAEISSKSLQQSGILPPSMGSYLDQTSLYSQEQFEIDGSVPIRQNSETDNISIFNSKSNSNLYNQTDREFQKSLQESITDQQSINNENSDNTSIYK